MTAIQFMDAEAMRIAAAHAMARLHQRYDLVLCPTVPGPPPLADAPTGESRRRRCGPNWAPWTFALQPDPAAGDHRADGPRRGAACRARVQIAAALYRDDLVLRAARAIELAEPSPIADRHGDAA